MTQETRHTLRITRTFDAPPRLVWRAWTEPEHLLRWLCPKDFAVLFADVDLRVGGAWRSGMRAPDGHEYIAAGTYIQIEPTERLVFTHQWERNHQEPPAETTITVTLTSLGEKTHMQFEQAGLATPESRDSHGGGWGEAFDNLTAHIAEGAHQQ